MKHLTSLFDVTADDVAEILTIAAKIKDDYNNGTRPPLLQGRVVTQVFEKPSLRTRVSFEAGMMQLGGSSIFISSRDAGLTGREALRDVARVLSSFSDVVVLRTFSQSLIDEFAQASRCPVVNGLSDERHPCQALTDALTMQEALGDLKGRRIVFVGDGNNVAASLSVIASLVEMSITLCTPPGYELNGQTLAEVKRRAPRADVSTTADPQQAVQNADVVYTDVWASMGQEAETEKRKKVFGAYQINADLMAAAPPNCLFMHCLPAHRGLEVTDEVLDGPQSLAFQQAENRMHLAKGLLVWLLGEERKKEKGKRKK